jgi:hypothetical protein
MFHVESSSLERESITASKATSIQNVSFLTLQVGLFEHLPNFLPHKKKSDTAKRFRSIHTRSGIKSCDRWCIDSKHGTHIQKQAASRGVHFSEEFHGLLCDIHGSPKIHLRTSQIFQDEKKL